MLREQLGFRVSFVCFRWVFGVWGLGLGVEELGLRVHRVLGNVDFGKQIENAETGITV